MIILYAIDELGFYFCIRLNFDTGEFRVHKSLTKYELDVYKAFYERKGYISIPYYEF